jgi:hypothetical protein
MSFQPDIFIGFLRRPGTYQNFPWLSSEAFPLLNNYRKAKGLKVALHTHPDVARLAEHLHLYFEKNDPSSADGFYTQSLPPTAHEKILVDERFIDLILHCYSKTMTPLCFSYWTEQGIPVLEEPFAADDAVYHPSRLPRLSSHDITYIGGWWPFKGQQLDSYLAPMKQHYGSRLAVYGMGWPRLSEGHVSDRRFKKIAWKSKINLVFHEPSQVQGIPVHVNERIFKLYALGVFALCDNNPCLREYFEDDEVVLCRDPEDMIEKCAYYLSCTRQRAMIARKAHRAVLHKHTYTQRAATLLSTLKKIYS